ncbi:MAG: ribonuclease HI [Caldilinea sp.]|nr:ribonuclease HI [Caldilinea sp.]MDW8439558.1 ribonuclease HI [Caldilineaceae bacterium]
MSPTRKKVTIYTDGAAEPNPGPGGYGAVLVCGPHRKQISGGFARTTNNRMELMAAIKGLEMLKEPCDVTLVSDSKYLVDAMTKGWARSWRRQGWKRSNKEPVVNPDLWERLLTLCDKHNVTFEWVKGHADHPENELCDRLAVAALQQPNLPPDEGYTEATGSAIRDAYPQTGLLCRACGTELEQRPTKSKPKPGQRYFYAYHHFCPNCGRIYLVEEAKRPISSASR